MIEVTLPTMTCGGCVRSVTQAVQQIDPGAKVQADLATHRVQIETSAEPAKITTALTDAGFEPAAA